jgi:hypothetical protein
LYAQVVSQTADGQRIYSFSPVFFHNTWNHLALSVKSSGYSFIYINGVLSVQGFLNSARGVTRRSNYIGKSNWNMDPPITADFDEIRNYNRVLNVSEIMADMISSSFLNAV